ncbi:protein yellow-like isoform X2 [Amphibalanus amphitrite]|uniref:protein yellow-like isoform X2 n=1 Tax=Amphibalanus amphitrite TaxID=1232801 RepID=UPI001C92297E|nr:protein yellow-like isoform X2 [Amphibalanus amphitrite]XP_043243918.1 protein yellow-like isoform X2 [Amphibalanus amphitrite]
MKSPPLLLLLVVTVSAAGNSGKYGELETLHEWARLDFDWASAEARETAIETGRYVPDYCALYDVKAVDGEVFVTVPRLRHGVPATVNRVLARSNDTVLSPYPSWELNTHGSDCKGIQNALAIEIDPQRRMWIIDSGSHGMFSRSTHECPAKLVVWDMVAGKEVRRFSFPEELVPYRQGAMLRALVLDTAAGNSEDWFAYVADMMGEQVLVYSWREDSAWNVTHPSMKYDASAIAVEIGSEVVSFPTAIDSLAISPRSAPDQRLFFAPLSSFHFFSIATSFLQNRTHVALASAAEINEHVVKVGTRSSQSEGMTVSDSGIMFYSVLNNNAIDQWNTSAPFSAKDQVYRDDTRLQWTSAFGWDGGYLYVASNRWHKAGLLAFSSSDELMYRVLRARVDMDSYMGPYRRGQRVGVAGSAPPRATTAAVALLCAVLAAVAV